MSNTRQIVSFFSIAIVVSVALAYIGGLWSVLDGSVGSNFAWQYLVVGPIYIAPFYAIFLVLGGLIFGVPTLIFVRRLGLSSQPFWLSSIGAVSGLLAGGLLFGGWLGFAALGFGAVYGAIGGLMSAVLWYQLVESHISND